MSCDLAGLGDVGEDDQTQELDNRRRRGFV